MRAVRNVFFGEWTLMVPLTMIFYAIMVGIVRLVKWLAGWPSGRAFYSETGVRMNDAILLMAGAAAIFLLLWLYLTRRQKVGASVTPKKRDGRVSLPMTTIIPVLFLLIVGIAWLSYRERNVGASATPAAFVAADPLDAEIEALRTNPTLSAVAAIDRRPPVPERREEVVAALTPLLDSESKSVRTVARNAIDRWKR